GLTDSYQPPADDKETQSLKVLPTLDVVATGDLSAHHQLLLSAYAEHTADRVWAISAASLLAAINTGRHLKDFATFLAQQTEHELPNSLATLISDVTRRAAQLTDLGHARLIECADPALAALIAHDRALRALCHPIGDRHLAVPLDQELKFRTALLKLGYVLPGHPS
ncbi:MAG: helicase-associated domain-containing protein, partial [Pseudonocardiaceae bacterium]